ncbi:hypothetical protein, partial [Prevotella pallens]|uniref:hypothetical protein n=1 Tax=Prevotella pallens TaxID=60133 RepID=UPI0028EE3C41
IFLMPKGTKTLGNSKALALAICFAVLFLVWIFLPTSVYSRILGLISNALGFLSMVLSYRSEEKNKKRTE